VHIRMRIDDDGEGVLVKDQEALENLELVLVGHRTSDSVVELLVTQRLLRL
jgi:hypothetical protein